MAGLDSSSDFDEALAAARAEQENARLPRQDEIAEQIVADMLRGLQPVLERIRTGLASTAAQPSTAFVSSQRHERRGAFGRSRVEWVTTEVGRGWPLCEVGKFWSVGGEPSRGGGGEYTSGIRSYGLALLADGRLIEYGPGNEFRRDYDLSSGQPPEIVAERDLRDSDEIRARYLGIRDRVASSGIQYQTSDYPLTGDVTYAYGFADYLTESLARFMVSHGLA